MMNPLQPSGYLRVAKGKTCLCFPHIFHLCVPYVALNQQQIYPCTVFNDCVSIGGTLYSQRGKRFIIACTNETMKLVD